MIQRKHIKKITSFLLLLVTVVTLVACSSKGKVPYGDISDNEYLSVGDNINVTEKEVYDNLRRQSGSVLPKIIEEKLFAGFKEQTEKLLEKKDEDEDSEAYWAQEEFDNIVKQAIFSTTDVDTIKKFKEHELEIAFNRFVDQQYVLNSKVNREELKSALTVFTFDKEDEDFATGYYTNEDLKSVYIIEMQKKVFARKVLDKEVLDEESDNYIKDSNVISHYKNNVKSQEFESNVFYFHFLSLNEANAALRSLNIKSNSRGNWFKIPDIRLAENINFGNEDESIQSTYMWEIIKKVNLTEKVKPKEEGSESTNVSESDYKRFYEAYNISESRDERLEKSEVLALFIDLYNVVNDRKLEVLDPTTITEEDLIDYEVKYANGEIYETQKDYDALTKVGSSLRNYIYDTLTEKKPFSTLRSVGNFRYLIFKLDSDYHELNFVSEDKDEDDNEKWITVDEIMEIINDEEHDKHDDLLGALKTIDGVVNSDNSINKDKLDEHIKSNIELWTKEVQKGKLTSSYVSAKVNEVYEEAKVEIFDDIVKIFYNQSANVEAKGKGKSGNDLLAFSVKLKNDFIKEAFDLDVIKFDVTVREFYTKLEASVGLETAIDLLINKLLINEYNSKDQGIFKDEEINEKDFKNEIKELINNFSNDAFAQAGYPASIGREQFLLLLFGTTNLNEAIELGYVVPELRSLYTEKYTDEVYDSLAYFAGKQHDMFKGVDVGHLLVYFDTDGDDSPEDPNEYFDTLSDTEVNIIKDAIIELYEEVLFEVGNDGLSADKLKAVADEFQSYARIPLGDSKPTRWEKYRKLGINLKFESIGSEITNTSNLPSNSSTLDPVFYNRAIKLHDIIMSDVLGDGLDENGAPIYKDEDHEIIKDHLPYLDYGKSLNVIQDPEVLDGEALDELMSNFGFHFIMVNSVSEKASAIYNEKDDNSNKPLYKVEIDGKDYSAYNEDSETITADQIRYFIEGNKLEDGVLLPSKVQTAFTNYFNPVNELFKGEIMKVEMLNQLLVDKNIKFKDNQEARFNTIREINHNQFHQYLLSGDDNEFTKNYKDIYGDWFTKFGIVIA